MNPLYIVIGIVLLAIIVLTVVYIVQQRKKKKAAALAEAEEGAIPNDDEIAVLVREAESKLAAAKLDGAKVAHLPVYLLLGDGASAKTNIMLHSGLDAELVAGQVYQQGNVASTRSANIWYTRRSLFVEAGGKLLGEAPNWKTLVRKLHPKTSVVGKGEQPPRAAVVFYDCENFTRPGALEAAAASARALRARLGEMCQSFGIRLPVYAVFTKVDRLPFFTDYVRNLSNDEATQVFGATLPMTGARAEGVYAEEETARLSGSFEALFRSLADARIEFLPRETDPTKLPAEYEFPREFRKIRQTVVQFLVDLCRPSQLATGPFLRGFYFSGVRPIIINETAPVQAAAAPQQANFGTAAGATGIFQVGMRQAAPVAQQPVVTGTRKVPQWLFVGHFFTDVLLVDRTAMGASGSSTKTSGARRILLGIAAGLCLLFTLFFTISYFKNRGLENQVSEAAQAIGSTQVTGTDFAPLDSLQRLDTLRKSVQTLSDWHRAHPPLMYRWFLYIGDDLYPEARRVYFARFKQLLFAQTQGNDLAYLQGLPATPGPDYQPTYNALKAYLITTSNHDKSTKEFLTPELMDLWQNGRKPDADRAQLARNQFDFYADELKTGNPYTAENDSAAVEKARVYLANMGGAQSVYAFMLSEASKANPAIDFNRYFLGSAPTVVDTHPVAGAFSKGGWGFMKDAIAHPDKFRGGEKWVLGDHEIANFDQAKLSGEIKALYYSDFVKEWTEYLRSGSVAKYKDLKDASVKLQQLSGNQSPLLELFSLAANNTDVDDLTVKESFQPVQAVTKPGNMQKFVAPENQNYINALIGLQASIDAVASASGTPTDDSKKPALASAQEATTQVRQMSGGFNPDRTNHIDLMSTTLLLEPIVQIPPLLGQLDKDAINRAGKDLCAQERPIMVKYPFNPNGSAEATLADFDSIFEPKKGSLWKFYNDNLQKLVQRNGSQFSAAPNAPMTVSQPFLNLLNRAGLFTEAAYANGATDPSFIYTVKPDLSPEQDSIKMTVDGQAIEFTQANSASKQFRWPGTAHGVQTIVTSKNIPYVYPSYDGLWGIFQFVQYADDRKGAQVTMLLKSGKQGKTVNDANGKPITLQFDITANPPVFDKGYFASMACVAEVAR